MPIAERTTQAPWAGPLARSTGRSSSQARHGHTLANGCGYRPITRSPAYSSLGYEHHLI